MADIKFSALTDGGQPVATDRMPAVRAGANVKIAPAVPFGPYADLAALQTAVPASAALAGRTANVGSGAPYASYRCDGVVWAEFGAAGVPSAFTARALTNTDNGDNLICATAQVATVNTGLASGFGCSFKGVVTFAGTATVTDVRTTGSANPWCALMQTGVDTYDVVGSKT